MAFDASIVAIFTPPPDILSYIVTVAFAAPCPLIVTWWSEPGLYFIVDVLVPVTFKYFGLVDAGPSLLIVITGQLSITFVVDPLIFLFSIYVLKWTVYVRKLTDYVDIRLSSISN